MRERCLYIRSIILKLFVAGVLLFDFFTPSTKSGSDHGSSDWLIGSDHQIIIMIIMIESSNQNKTQADRKSTCFKFGFWKIWHTSRDVVEKFIEEQNKHQSAIKFMADTSCTDSTFFETTIYRCQRFNKASVLDIRMHFKPAEPF